MGAGDEIIKGDWEGRKETGSRFPAWYNGYWYFDYNLDGKSKILQVGGAGGLDNPGRLGGTGKRRHAIFRLHPGTGYSDEYNLDGIVDNSFSTVSGSATK